jgi:hypothetical protein
MKLAKNVRYLVRVRDYETVHIEVGAEADHRDLGVADNDLAHMAPKERQKFTADLHTLINAEVDRLARNELETIAEWSEISPNLAEDYLDTQPAYLQRNQHARDQKTATPAPSGRRVRRGGGRGTPPSAA